MILIVAIRGDFHALAIERAVRENGYRQCFTVEVDRIAGSRGVSWRLHASGGGCARLASRCGEWLDPECAKVVWWRRGRSDQTLDLPPNSDDERRLINNDCRGALTGILAANTDARWISTPEATDRGSSKPFQLKVAAACGFRVPETLVSQDRHEVVSFREYVGSRLIVKPVVGTGGRLVFTQFVDDPREIAPQSFAISPAIFQEYIPGREHIRLNCFGDDSVAAIIESDELDWRPNLNVPISIWEVPEWLHRRVRRVLDALGLEMGVVDLKRTPDGELVWLEVNPQGQFLFLEGLTGFPFARVFSEYLIRLAEGDEAARGSAEGAALVPADRAHQQRPSNSADRSTAAPPARSPAPP